MADLKPCPFCGNDEPRMVRRPDESLSSHAIVEWLHITCDECGVDSVSSEVHEDVIAAWNQRAVDGGPSPTKPAATDDEIRAFYERSYTGCNQTSLSWSAFRGGYRSCERAAMSSGEAQKALVSSGAPPTAEYEAWPAMPAARKDRNMSNNESIVKRALEISDELRRAEPATMDFADGWQQRYLDRQDARHETALAMARDEARLAESSADGSGVNPSSNDQPKGGA